MAINTTFTLKVKAEGLADATEQAAKLRKEMEAAGVASGKISVNVAANKGGKSAIQSAKDAEEQSTYRNARAGAGTGAASRDFAKQAQGLGGLVHLYATFAANLFAASAAFTALSKAMDTTNMVKGLDQIGAASGKNLGTLAKQLVTATDGAISLRDAMEATSKASAAGMDSRQIKQMAEIAKKASQALGVDMSDAVSRLTRGISKLEPELLDELGIMTKVGKATEDYARSVGKSATSLTDFERRQAFANAVLKEGADKFSSIEIDSNPYSKILASTKDLLQSGLELVNKVLSPIVKLLAESPTGLSAAMAAIGVALFKQAVPAIGAFRENLNKSAETARKIAVERSAAAKAAHAEELKLVEQRANELADKELERSEVARLRLEKAAASKSRKFGKTFAPIFEQDPSSITDAQLARFEKEAATQRKKNNLDAAKGYEEAAKSLRTWRDAELELIKVQEASKKKLEERNNAFSVSGQLARSAEAANQAAAARSIKSAAAEILYVKGIRAAYQELNAQIAVARAGARTVDFGAGPETIQRMSALNAGWTRLTGTISIASQAIGIFGNAIQTAFFWVGAIVATFQILDSVLGTAGKELSAFNTSLDALNESSASAGRTIEKIFNPSNLSAEKHIKDITAVANAYSDLSDSVEDSVSKLSAVRSQMGLFTKTIDSLKLWGGTQEIVKSIAEGIRKSVKLADIQGAGTALRKKLAAELGSADTSVESIVKALDNSPEKLQKVVAILSEAKVQIRTAEQAFVGLNEKFAAGNTILQDFKKSLAPTDLIGKIGTATVGIAEELGKIISMPATDAIAALATISRDTAKLSFVDPKDAKTLITFNNELNKITEKNKLLTSQKENLPALIEAAGRKERERGAASAANKGLDPRIAKEFNDAREERIRLINLSKTIDQQIAANKAEAANLLVDFTEVSTNALSKGAAEIQRSIGVAFDRASIALAKAELQGPSGRGDAQRAYELTLKDIKLQEDQISIGLKLIDVQHELADELKKRNLKDSLTTATGKDREKIQQQLDALEAKTKFKTIGDATATLQSSDATSTDKIAAQESLGRLQEQELGRAQLLTLEAQKRTEELRAQQAAIQENFDYQSKLNSLDQRAKAAKTEQLNLLAGILGYSISSVQAAQQAAAEQELTNRQAQERLTILRDIDQLQLAKGSEGKIADKRRELAKLEVAQAQELNTVRERGIITAANMQNEAAQRNAAFLFQNIEYQRQLSDASLSVNQAKLDAAKQSNTMSEKGVILAQAQLDREAAMLRYSREISAIERDRLATVGALNAKIAAVTEISQSKSATPDQKKQAQETLAALQLEKSQVEELSRARAKANDANLAATTAARDAMNDAALAQANFNSAMEKLVDIADSLAGAFGDIGKSVGTGLTKLLTNVDKFSKKEQRIRDTAKTEKWAEAKLEDELQKNRLSNYAEDVSAMKDMFSEKTAAYKVLAATEQAIHVYKLAMMAAEITAGWAATSQKVAQATVETSAAAAPAAANATKDTPGPLPVKIAAGLAAFAFVASLAKGGGGSAPSVPGGSSASDRQSTQGTGMSWVDGKKVENGGGVFGDASAKSNSIKNSLKLIGENTLEGITYSKGMLEALQSIDKAISGTAKGLYATSGVRAGTAFGTQEGTNTSGGFLGISSLFGKSVTKDIIDSGIAIKGAFTDLANGLGRFTKYETTQTTTKKSGFLGIGGSTKTSVNTQQQQLDAAVSSQITEIFKNANNALVEVASRLGMTSTEVNAKLAKIPADFETSLRGLTGDDLEAALNASISNVLDSASKTLFSSMEQYRKFGEGLLETVVRVIDSSEKLSAGLKGIGVALEGVTKGKADYKVSEALIDAAGGLSTLLGYTKNFSNEFLTEAQRLVPVQESVNKEMARLGVSFIQTREQFAQYVQALDLTKPGQQQLFIDLMKVSEGFAMTHSALEDTISVTDAANKAIDFRIRILELEGKMSASVALSREQALKGLTAELAAQQKYIWALEDRQDLIKAEINYIEVLGYSYTALLATREMELRSLTEEQKIIKKAQYAAEDKLNTDKLLLELMTAEGKEAEVLAHNRETELKALSATDAAIKKRIFALEDEAKLKAKLKTAYDRESAAINGTITSLTQSIKTLNDYKDSLAVGDKSILSPTEKYAEAKRQAISVAAIATGIATTDAEKLAKQDAINKLPQVSDAFLAASQAIYASSEQYTTDYGFIRDLISSTASDLTAQKSTAELQLDQLKTSVSALIDISDKTETTNDILIKLYDAMSVTQGFQVNSALSSFDPSGIIQGLFGAIADPSMGLTMPNAGIQPAIPTTPNIVNSLSVTNKELIAQIQELKAEVAGLRADQKQQTSDLIVTNYDANSKASDATADAIEESFVNSRWETRNTFMLR